MTKRIRVTILNNETTARAICRLAGISESTFYSHMRNPEGWRLGDLVRVAAALGVPLSHLVEVVDE